jgi:hypothetical protein
VWDSPPAGVFVASEVAWRFLEKMSRVFLALLRFEILGVMLLLPGM